MSVNAILYVPSDTPEAMALATKKVAGVPLIVRGTMTLAQSDIERVTLLVADTQREKIINFLARYSETRLPKVEILSYEEPYGVGSHMVDALSKIDGDDAILINANLIFETLLVKTLVSSDLREGEILMTREGAHPLPAYRIKKDDLSRLREFVSARPRSIESCIRHLVENLAVKHCTKPVESNSFLLKHPRDRAVAEKSLAEAIRHGTGGPIAKHVNKRISLPISLFLSKLWISPNTITAFNIVIGVFSGVFVADGHRYWVILLGAALFQLASIVDGCDGEVAKLTFRCSKFGQYADTLCDNLSLGSFMTGLIAGYWRHTHSYVAYVAGAVMVSMTAVTLFWMVRFLRKNTQSASLVTYDKEFLQKPGTAPEWLRTIIKYAKYLFKKDMFSFVFLCFAAAGILYWWLFIAAFGTAVSACTLTYLSLRGRSEMHAPARTLQEARS